MDMPEITEAPAAPQAAPEGRAKRVRKEVKRLVDTHAEKKVDEWKPATGTGVAMRDIEYTFKYINKLTRNDERLQALHKIFYGKRGLKATIKPFCLDFAGIVYTDDRQRDDVLQKLYQWTSPMIKTMMDTFNIDRSSKTGGVDKEGLSSRFCDWLENPAESVQKESAASKKKVKAKTKKFKKAMAADKNKPKKGKSAYIYFGIEQRANIVAANPEAKNTEIMALVGVEWGKLTDEQKVPYETNSTKDKERYTKEMETYVPAPFVPKPKKVKKKKAPSKKRSASSSSSSSSKKKAKSKKKKKTKSKSKFKTEITYVTKKAAPLFPHSRYMMTKNPPKKIKKRKRATSTKSKRAKKKARVESEEESDDEESEEDESEEEEESGEESEYDELDNEYSETVEKYASDNTEDGNLDYFHTLDKDRKTKLIKGIKEVYEAQSSNIPLKFKHENMIEEKGTLCQLQIMLIILPPAQQ